MRFKILSQFRFAMYILVKYVCMEAANVEHNFQVRKLANLVVEITRAAGCPIRIHQIRSGIELSGRL